MVSAVLAMPTCGTGGRLAVAVHGDAVLAGAQTAFGRAALAVLVMFVGGLPLIVALTV